MDVGIEEEAKKADLGKTPQSNGFLWLMYWVLHIVGTSKSLDTEMKARRVIIQAFDSVRCIANKFVVFNPFEGRSNVKNLEAKKKKAVEFITKVPWFSGGKLVKYLLYNNKEVAESMIKVFESAGGDIVYNSICKSRGTFLEQTFRRKSILFPGKILLGSNKKTSRLSACLRIFFQKGSGIPKAQAKNIAKILGVGYQIKRISQIYGQYTAKGTKTKARKAELEKQLKAHFSSCIAQFPHPLQKALIRTIQVKAESREYNLHWWEALLRSALVFKPRMKTKYYLPAFCYTRKNNVLEKVGNDYFKLLKSVKFYSGMPRWLICMILLDCPGEDRRVVEKICGELPPKRDTMSKKLGTNLPGTYKEDKEVQNFTLEPIPMKGAPSASGPGGRSKIVMEAFRFQRPIRDVIQATDLGDMVAASRPIEQVLKELSDAATKEMENPNRKIDGPETIMGSDGVAKPASVLCFEGEPDLFY